MAEFTETVQKEVVIQFGLIIVTLITVIGSWLSMRSRNKKQDKKIEAQTELMTRADFEKEERVERLAREFERTNKRVAKWGEDHAKEHKLMNERIEKIDDKSDVVIALVEQNKTLFANQKRTDDKVDKVDGKIDDLKDLIITNIKNNKEKGE